MTRGAPARGGWLGPVAVALLAGALLLILARPTGVDVFFRRTHPPVTAGAPTGGDATSPGAPATGAIIAIRVDVETDVSTIDVTPPPPPPPPAEKREPPREEPPPAADGAGDSRPDLDVDDLLDRAGVPRTGGSASGNAVPPRPIEITWPETRRLKHCIGLSVEVRILVGEDGGVQEVDAAARSLDRDCLEAALDAARRIKFEPGRVGGLATAVWTQVRIDFERKK